MSAEEEKIAARAKGLRRNLYEHVDVSVRTLDIIIAACGVAIIVLVILGIMNRS
jgi:hypothetical protein